jgi:hypothetical protein
MLQWHRPTGDHREEGVEFKNLFIGEDGAPAAAAMSSAFELSRRDFCKNLNQIKQGV